MLHCLTCPPPWCTLQTFFTQIQTALYSEVSGERGGAVH
jgi:hypothetical protein